MISPKNSSVTWFSRTARFAGAAALTALLLVFLVMSRWIERGPEILTLRSVEGTDPVSMPAPPPPSPLEKSQPTPPPPADPLELPRLDLEIESVAPPIKALLAENKLTLDMKPAEFANALQPAKMRSLFSASDLDDKPRLLNRPAITFPAAQKRKGINEGRVTLEVLINAGGKVTVRRVISNSHPDFVPVAKSFAANARFSPRKKTDAPSTPFLTGLSCSDHETLFKFSCFVSLNCLRPGARTDAD